MTTVEIIESEAIAVESGCDLLAADGSLIADVSDDLVADGSSISYHAYNTIHRTCTLMLTRQLLWGQQQVRPWMQVTDELTHASVRTNLGVYLLTTPDRSTARVPMIYTCRGFDRLQVLNNPYGRSYALQAGEYVLAAVQTLVASIVGGGPLFVDPYAAASVAESTKVWPLDEGTFVIHIVNDMLASIGYRGLWVDGDGNYRATRYYAPSETAPSWTFDTQSGSTIVGEERIETADYFAAPNRWVFVRDDPALTVPVEGDGIYTVLNSYDGPTSISARGGRIITSVQRLDAVDQAALITQGDRIVEADKRVDRRLSVSSGPIPTFGHFDTVRYVDPVLGPSATMLVTDWDLPLNGADMKLELKAV